MEAKRFIEEAEEALNKAVKALEEGRDWDGLMLIDEAGKALAKAALFGDERMTKLSLDKDFFEVERLLAFSKRAPCAVLAAKLRDFAERVSRLKESL